MSVRCDYLLGEDGGRRVAGLAGVGYEGLGVVTQTATLHVSADFSTWVKAPDILIRWIFSPQSGVLVVMDPMGPQRWGPQSEEWVIHLNYPVDGPARGVRRAGRGRRTQGAGHSGCAAEDPQLTRWSVEAVMASAFRAGRVFLLGDAAHRYRPPGAWD